MITDLGSLTLGVITPSLPTATLAISAACAITAPTLEAQLDVLASFTPSISLSIAAQITIVQATLDALLEASIAVPPIPSLDLSAQVTLALAAVATLTAQLDIINAQLSIAAALNLALANGSVRLLKFNGNQDDFGAELGAELGAPTTACNALVLLTSNGASWTAMQTLFKTS